MLESPHPELESHAEVTLGHEPPVVCRFEPHAEVRLERACQTQKWGSPCKPDRVRRRPAPSFDAKLVAVDGTKVATGRDFDDRGQVSDKAVALPEARARALADGLDGATFAVRSVEEKPYKSTPKAPFMTSTLQQEGGRKLRLSSSQVMRVAQGLYERGFITYMRTDSVTLSDEAMNATRSAIQAEYGQNYLSPSPSSTRRSRRTRRKPTRRSAPRRRTAHRSRSRPSSTARISRCTASSGSARSPHRWPMPPA